MHRNIANKIILVTGGASGIGYQICDKFLDKGAKTVIVIDIRDDGEEAVKELKVKHGENRIVLYKGDVAKEDFLSAVHDDVIKVFHTLDILVNNAGIVDENNWRNCMEVNIMATMNWTLKYFHHMRKDKGGNGGTIINLSSINGFRESEFTPIYCASKFAVLGFSKSLGHEYNYEAYGVRVLALCPGYTRTNLAKDPASKVWQDEPRKSVFMNAHNSFTEWQEADAVGRAAVQVFESAASGTAWLIERNKPISQV